MVSFIPHPHKNSKPVTTNKIVSKIKNVKACHCLLTSFLTTLKQVAIQLTSQEVLGPPGRQATLPMGVHGQFDPSCTYSQLTSFAGTDYGGTLAL